MKKFTLLSLVGITSIALAHTAWAAGHGGGGGGGFGGGGGGGGFHGGGGGGGFRGGGAVHMSPGARFSFGTRPVYGHPVYARPAGQSIARSVRSTTAGSNRQQNHVASAGGRTAQASRSTVAGATNQRATSQRASTVGNHIFARHDTNWHRDWDHRGAHYSNGHWWCYDGSAWIGLDEGFYPWDYYPYYAYDYYPYDYYPGYYSDVEPEYYSAGVSSSVDQNPDPNVTAVQTDLTKLGYYHGPIDGLFGRDTRDALARYQTAQHLAVTGTLTTETLQSLGV
ncbi:MAG: hypothetical protein QOG67_1405 [Verrucomicrobiota bacterium]|jgi:hypothetical protein